MVWGKKTHVRLFVFILAFESAFSNPSDIVKSFDRSYENGYFNRLTIDQNSGTIFIGAVNRIYRLDPDLSVVETFVTGPKNESFECDNNLTSGELETLTDNVNKVLLIDGSTNILISCGTVCFGICSFGKLNNISVRNDVFGRLVVLNDPSSTTVAFIGPGLYTSPVVYVAISNTKKTGDQETTPAISIRSLNESHMFEKIEIGVKESSIQFVQNNKYLTEYVYGFASGRFSYFLTIQQIDWKTYITKLIRVCHDVVLFESYTEIPLTCSDHSGTVYNFIQTGYVGKVDPLLAKTLNISVQDDVLFAIFNLKNTELSNGSSLCIYSLKAIDKMFIETIQRCFDGIEKSELKHIGDSKPCSPNSEKKIDENYCGDDDHKYIGGSISMDATSVFVFDSTITAVASTPVKDRTVVFVGTSHGHIKKVVVDKRFEGIEYGDVIVQEGSAVQKDLFFDSKLMFLYVMTERRVSKVRLDKCSLYSASCSTCMNTKDPFCGWCSSEYKCSREAECANALNWVSYASPGCPNVTGLIPVAIQIGSSVNFNIAIQNLPLFVENVTCTFSVLNINLEAPGRRSENRIHCPSPKFDKSISFPIGLHNYTANLSINVGNDLDIASTQFTLFNCSSYSSCTECISIFPCDWCLYEHRCSHTSSARYCKNKTIVKFPPSDSMKDRSNSNFCPSVSAISEETNQILVSSGIKKAIEVNVESIGLIYQMTKSFHCQLDNGLLIVAHLFNYTIYCDPIQLISDTPYKTMNLSIIWDGSNKLDNKYGVNVLVFNCKRMAKNCGDCISIKEMYGCGWCQSTNACEIKELCKVENDKVWLSGSNICPNPEIYSFLPLIGVVGVDTVISIQGINFRQNASTISVANETCHPFESSSESVQINCKVRSNDINEGPITIQIANSYYCQSKLNFSFVNPAIESLHPMLGPKSGKTLLSIGGRYLNAGNIVQSFINDKPCEIYNQSNSGEELVCRGVPWNGTDTTGTLSLKFGNRTIVYEHKFQYVSDPVINFTNIIPRGIVSGGVRIEVTGENLTSVLKPQIYVYLDGESHNGDCIFLPNTSMVCESPTLNPGRELKPDNPLKLEYGFLMDEIEAVKNLSSQYGHFLLFPDPDYDKFKEDIKYLKSEYLTLNGQNLNVVCSEADIEVTIEQNVCNITSLTHNQLVCLLPAEDKMILNGEDTFDVKVKVGHKMFELGKISYSSRLTKFIILGVVLSLTVIIVLLILFFFVYKKKSTESIKNLKKMEAQMDKLELRVAAECKEAFAELQTEIFDLTGDLSERIPFLDYQTYTMNVLFPNVEDHSIMLWTMPECTKYERGLNMFQQLVMNKTFLLQLIDTLESNKYFSMKDRVNTASYLMIILQNDMQYCSDILKSLLAKLIEKSVKGKCHPKLLLRRTDSVAEKMLSSWLTFLLYRFLKERAGEPLYKLFRSVKGQLDKGPVDCVTSEAKYSLVEGKLLRESINFQFMSVYASFPLSIKDTTGIEMETENIIVKVLDCDTINQVKEKCLDALYKGKSFSKRPNNDEFDLEWKTGSRVRLILHDLDDTNEIENGWKKLNTLKHYKVPNGGHLVLVLKRDSVDKFSTIKSLNYDTLRQKELKSECSTLKLWHLVKHDDEVFPKEGERSNKMVSEIYLTRLLSTKGTLQKFIDDLFKTIFNAQNKNSPLPLAIKFLFDFLDDQALQHNISDPEVVHSWKNNSLPLRFWVNLIKNPNFIFDIHKSNAVDACLSVIAQTFMDSCSMADHVLGKDSPSSKLLYAKDIPLYKEWVGSFYVTVKNMEAISDQDMNVMLAEESNNHAEEFNRNYALQELYSHVLKYSDQLRVILEEDKHSQQQQLAAKLNHLHDLMKSGIPV